MVKSVGLPPQRSTKLPIAFEIAFLMFLGVVTVVFIAAAGRPLAEAYAERLKWKYRQLDSEAEFVLKQRVAALEDEVRDLKRQVIAVQDTTDFTNRLLEKHGMDTSGLETGKPDKKELGGQ